MLSASQGKYELHKSNIGENINYIYYFTYFHPYSKHPYWEEFKVETKIREKVEELRGFICCLWRSYTSLSQTVINVQLKIECLVYKLVWIGRNVHYSIHDLKEHINKQVTENKKCIDESVKEIEAKITDIKCYIECKLNEIKGELDCKKLKFEEKIKCSCEKLSSEILFVKTTLRITREITYNVKTTIETISEIKGDYSHQIQHVIEQITQKSEETKESRIEKRLQSISHSIEHLKDLNTNFPDPICLTYECIGDYLNKLEKVNDYIEKLDCVITYIKTKRKKIEDIIKKNTENITITKSTEGNLEKYLLKEQKGGLLTKSIKLDLYYKKEITKIEKLVSARHTIDDLLKVVCCDVDKLDEQVKDIRKELKDIETNLEILRNLKGYNEELKGRERQLYLIKCYSLNLKSVENLSLKNIKNMQEIEQIQIKLKRFAYYAYSTCLKLLGDNVQSFLDKREIRDSDKLGNDKHDLKLVKDDLGLISGELDKLAKYGKNTRKLNLILLSIKGLESIKTDVETLTTSKEEFQKVLQEVKPPTVKPEPQNADSTYYKLKSDLQILKPLVQTIHCIDTRIQLIERNVNSISKVKPDLQTLTNLHNNLGILSFNAQSIGQLNQTLKVIQNLELSKEGDVKLTKELEQFKVKFCCVSLRLSKVTNCLAEYLSVYNDNKGVVVSIKNGIKIIRETIEKMKDNIEEIKEAGKEITEHYDSYTTAFTAFNEALNKLETCLDFLIRYFLRCSLCTTTKNYNLWLKPTTCNSCPTLIGG